MLPKFLNLVDTLIPDIVPIQFNIPAHITFNIKCHPAPLLPCWRLGTDAWQSVASLSVVIALYLFCFYLTKRTQIRNFIWILGNFSGSVVRGPSQAVVVFIQMVSLVTTNYCNSLMRYTHPINRKIIVFSIFLRKTQLEV